MRVALLLLVFGLVFVDLLTKALALHLMVPEQQIAIADGWSLALVFNETGLSANYQRYFGTNQRMQLLIAFICLILAGVVIPISRQRWRFWRKVVLFYAVYGGLLLAANLVSPLMPIINLTPWLIMLVTKLSAFPLVITLLLLSRTFYFRTTWGFVLAGGMGNTLSLLYPPYRVVDFIYIEWLTSVSEIGVFNFADVYSIIASVLLATSPFYFLCCVPSPKINAPPRFVDVAAAQTSSVSGSTARAESPPDTAGSNLEIAPIPPQEGLNGASGLAT